LKHNIFLVLNYTLKTLVNRWATFWWLAFWCSVKCKYTAI